MPWTRTNSSMIEAYDYDRSMRVLMLRFVSGRQVALQDVPSDTVADFEDAPSKGKFFHNNLRDQFRAL